ncbi:protein phosphatase 2C domain-containing protein [Streptomyces hayashii]|uniref:protein phosphatase 2C domain-containing protein n=1 Tax=Streptomyces hayashii TaxID=2839966 RepID=UPI00403C1314
MTRSGPSSSSSPETTVPQPETIVPQPRSGPPAAAAPPVAPGAPGAERDVGERNNGGQDSGRAADGRGSYRGTGGVGPDARGDASTDARGDLGWGARSVPPPDGPTEAEDGPPGPADFPPGPLPPGFAEQPLRDGGPALAPPDGDTSTHGASTSVEPPASQPPSPAPPRSAQAPPWPSPAAATPTAAQTTLRPQPPAAPAAPAVPAVPAAPAALVAPAAPSVPPAPAAPPVPAVAPPPPVQPPVPAHAPPPPTAPTAYADGPAPSFTPAGPSSDPATARGQGGAPVPIPAPTSAPIPAPDRAPDRPVEPTVPDHPPAVLTFPALPASKDHVGSGPPTYDAEPTALPAADPDELDDLVADTVLEGARYGAWTLRAASVRGDSARYRGEPRRDSLLTARFGTGEHALILVAMATGARATPGAHRAAAEVCRWIGKAVGRSHVRLAEDIRAARRGDLKSGLHRLTDRSLGRLRASAAEQGLEPDEYAATLRCLLLPADPECRTRVFFGVGAGGLFRLRGGVWRDIEPQVGEVVGEPVVGFGSLPSETPEGDRLTMDLGITTPPNPYDPDPGPPRAPFRFRASVARPGDTLLMCTGGLADPLRGEPRLSAYLTGRWSDPAPPGLAAFLADTQVRVKGYADDRTAAAVWEA